ncbi:glycosyltransferase [Mesobacillus boroniphilus JCM 21738]|uniref:Glycosyltransferase n=1 Tax=Mesobacillus boroniphilus JCM 21738 TaxID=1294265 RepID=W4RR97_9BACI|nr:glycosyltransferase [Mesobacillus boroniphilus JCM 21738]
MVKPKLITLIMPAYNEEKNIAEAINSVLSQKYENFELLIVDDGSTDKTGQIVNDLAIRHSEKITFFQPGKIGKNAAFNLAANHAKGDWFYFMGADDLLPPDALQNWMKYVEQKDSNKRIAVCGRMKVFSTNKKYDRLILPKNKKTFNWSGPLTLMSKGMLSEVTPIPTKYPNEDTWWSLCIRFFAEERIRIDDIIVYYRIHEGNAISRNSNYSIFNDKYHSRQIAIEEFLKRYKKRLKQEEQKELSTEIMLENYRYNGEMLKIIFKINCGLKKKVRAVFFSNALFFKIKKKLDRLMLGH